MTDYESPVIEASQSQAQANKDNIANNKVEIEYLNSEHKQLKRDMDTRLAVLNNKIKYNRISTDANLCVIELDRLQVKRNWNMVVSTIWSVVTVIISLLLFVIGRDSFFTSIREAKYLTYVGMIIAGCILVLIYMNYKRLDNYYKDEAQNNRDKLQKCKDKLKQEEVEGIE